MDIVDALLKHHKEIQELLPKAGHEKKRFDLLRKQLEIHEYNEDVYFLNLIREKKEVGEHAAKAVEEHHVIRLMLVDLENFPRNHDRWLPKYEVFQDFTERHLKREEENIFRWVRQVMHKKELQGLGEEYEAAANRQMEAI